MGSPQSDTVEWTFRSAVGGISESRLPLKIRVIRAIRVIRDLRRTRPNATCIQTMNT